MRSVLDEILLPALSVLTVAAGFVGLLSLL